MMASSLRGARIKDSDSEDSYSSIGIIEETTGGLDSWSESKLDRLLENESDIEVRTDWNLWDQQQQQQLYLAKYNT